MKNMSHWPTGVPAHLVLPETSLYYNLEVSAARYPTRPAAIYYGNTIAYATLKRQVDALAGYLTHACGVARGDRVALFLENCPQFNVGFYAILRADAVVVPVNTMDRLEEFRYVVQDSGAKVAIFGQELAANVVPLLGHELQHAIGVCYADDIDPDTDLPLPAAVAAPRENVTGTIAWHAALKHSAINAPMLNGPDDLAVIPYTSGTTGVPKGCMHTHRSVMHTTIANSEFNRIAKDEVALIALPMFHVTGLQVANTVIYGGSTMVMMTRWDRHCAAMLIARHHVTTWTAIPAMLVDLLAKPNLDQFNLRSLTFLAGGGAAMPAAVADHIQSLWGLPYVEGYGLTETMAPSHINPAERPKPQCLGIPIEDTSSIIVDPETLEALPVGSTGEILTRGPQVFQGYWGKPVDTARAFAEVAGTRYFRTGDLGYVDAEGYFFMVDRVKRMINAAGFKVWPAEVENLLYAHPAVQEACVIACRDPHRGESVKALVVRHPQRQLTSGELISWARERMAAYKVPHVVEFVTSLPKSGSGKIAWRQLQEKELRARTRDTRTS